MPKIIATLKQHTPIMHFQHDEDGATLRGTELKSGLDAFLNAYTKTGNTVKNEKNEELPERPEWHMGTKKALNYRVMVQAENSLVQHLLFNPKIDRDQAKLNEGYLDITNTPFFALMGNEKAGGSKAEEEVEKYAACIAGSVKVTFMVPNDELAKIIVQWLPIYFLVNNFGARKSKGFGSFTVRKLTVDGVEQEFEENCEALLKAFLAVKQPDTDAFEYALYAMKNVGSTNQNGFLQNKTERRFLAACPWLTVMENINWLYKLMKSGYNLPNTDPKRKIYHRSYLMKGYAYHKKNGGTYSNDKRAIKQCIAHIGNPSFKGYLAYDDEKGVKQDNYDEEGKMIPGNTGILKRYYPPEAQVSDLQDFRLNFEKKYRFVRAMLGLADNMQYRTPKNSPAADKTTVNIADKKRMYQEGSVYYVSKKTDDTIRRFESPLLFKPVEINGNWQCFILLKKIPKEMFEKEFFFYLSREKRRTPETPKEKKGDDIVTSPRDCFCIKTPSTEEFNLVEFMDFCCSNHPDLRDESRMPMFKCLDLKKN